MRFRRTRAGITAKVDPSEAALLASCALQLLELLGHHLAAERTASDDPLADLVGLPPAEVPAPDDPALARLFPDAYGPDVPGGAEAAAEFRRFTQADLASGKRAALQTVLQGLGPVLEKGGRLVRDRDDADAWLIALNDLRLTLGSRLEVTEDVEDELDALAAAAGTDDDDPRRLQLAVFGWLAAVQGSLLHCLEPRPDGSR